MNMDVKQNLKVRKEWKPVERKAKCHCFPCNATIAETELSLSQCFILKQVKTITPRNEYGLEDPYSLDFFPTYN